MKAFDPSVVVGKLTFIEDRINRLRRFSQTTLKEYKENPDYQDIAERNLEVLIQAAADTNRYLLKRQFELSFEKSSQITNADSFLMIAETGVLPKLLALQLAESGKFRNVLAHLYDEILPEKVIEAVEKALQYYPNYFNAIQAYLDTIEDEA